MNTEKNEEKNNRPLPGLADMHCHTHHSHDSCADLDELCKHAVSKGLSAIAITDHCDIWLSGDSAAMAEIDASFMEACRCAETYAGKLEVLRGIEIGEALWNADEAQKIIFSHEYDVVLCSVHSVRFRRLDLPYSGIDFSRMPPDELKAYLTKYFEELLQSAKELDYDVLTHLTCPLRYIRGKYGIHIDLSDYRELIDEILKTVIERKKALEINTSCVGTPYDRTLPDFDTIKRYLDFGGTMITLASDAHVVQNVGKDFDAVRRRLKLLGVNQAYLYRRRRPFAYLL